MPIDLNDFIINDKQNKLYRHTCNECGADRGYIHKNKTDICRRCAGKKSHINISKETRQKMSASKKGNVPYNKGKKLDNEETRAKMSIAKKGKTPHNKGSVTTLETKIKLSCINRGIEIEEFNGFATPQNHKERSKIRDLGLDKECLEKANFTCCSCGKRGSTLHAHHLNSWKFFPEQRYLIDNLICLCKKCHNLFHNIYGNGKKSPNTREQFEEWVDSQKEIKE